MKRFSKRMLSFALSVLMIACFGCSQLSTEIMDAAEKTDSTFWDDTSNREEEMTVSEEKSQKKRDLDTRIGKAPLMSGCEKEQEDYNRFVEYMNEKAKSIGMTDSLFNDAAGMHNISTARDLLRLALYAKQSPVLDFVWSQNSHISRVQGPKERTRESESKSVHPDLNDYYEVVGRKGGTLVSRSHKLFVYNLVSCLKIPNSEDQLVVVVMYAEGDNKSARNRFQATRQVADLALQKYADPQADISGISVCCENAIAAVLPAGGKSYDDLRILYEKDADEKGRPMSVSKVLTALCVLDIIENIKQTMTYHKFDTNIGAFYAQDFFADDQVTVEDALYILMLESSNVTAQALARNAGAMLATEQ